MTTNCAVCGIETPDHSGMLCDDCNDYADQEAREMDADAATDPTLYFEPRKFYVSAEALKASESPTPFICIIQGETGYYPTAAVFTQEVADKINALNNTTPAELEAAVLCSMFDCWQNFEKIKADFETRTNQEPGQ